MKRDTMLCAVIVLRQLSRYKLLNLMAIVLVMLVLDPGVFAADISSSPPAGLSREEALRLGEAMYREGVLPSGEYMQAVVEGDIPVEGPMFSCAHCHMRSGLGSVEGTIVTPPTNGAKLFKPFKSGQEFTEQQRKHLPSYLQPPDIRPAYTDAMLADVIRTGIDPGGRKLDPIMPLYLLEGRDLDILVYYLKNLSSSPSPGATDRTLRFATIVSEEVRKGDRDAMLLALSAYIKDRQSKAYYYKARTRRQLFAEEMDLSYRELTLATWELKGTPDTWRSQLEAYYRKEPVFALLGGIVKGSWSPIHEFCEKNRIPCIFPVTDQPVLSDNDWYTLYFSKGPYQEGEAVAKFLKDKGGPAVQIYRKTDEGMRLAQGYRDTAKKLGVPAADEVALNPDEEITDSFWSSVIEKYRDGSLILWLGIDDLTRIARTADADLPVAFFASSTVLGQSLNLLPEKMRQRTFITYPFRLPDDRKRIDHIVKPWLKVKKIPETNLAVSTEMYFLGTLLTDVFMHMQRNYYRDYFLDVIDMLQDESDTIANYPRLSFGPGQRYASKGCYIVQLSAGKKPRIIRKSDWVIH